MTSFGTFIKSEIEKNGWHQTKFGAIIFKKLKLLAKVFEIDYKTMGDLYFAHKFAKDAYEYKCSESVFSVTEVQAKYLKEINTTLGKLTF